MTIAGRKEAILKIIVEGYINEASPLASTTIARKYDLKVSPATIRNDMAYLEEQGYIARLHSSAGSMPTDKAYRYYVESISEGVELTLAEQRLIYQLFKETKEEIEQWLKLVAALLARFVHNIAMITYPRAPQCRLKHLHLVGLQDFAALLILVLCQAKVMQQTLSFSKKITQDEFTRLANRLSTIYTGMTSSEIQASKSMLAPEEEQVSECLIEMMSGEDKSEYGMPHLEGLRLLLGQPEFAKSHKILDILEVLETEDWLSDIAWRQLDEGGIKVIIGEENPREALQDLSLVISQYGIPDKASGVIGVLGPKRMNYARAISSLNYLSTLLNKSVAEYF